MLQCRPDQQCGPSQKNGINRKAVDPVGGPRRRLRGQRSQPRRRRRPARLGRRWGRGQGGGGRAGRLAREKAASTRVLWTDECTRVSRSHELPSTAARHARCQLATHPRRLSTARARASASVSASANHRQPARAPWRAPCQPPTPSIAMVSPARRSMKCSSRPYE